MKKHTNILLGLVVVFVLQGCSTKRDTFLNRSYHGITAKYNILYNGNLAFEKGLKELNDNYSENFWKILPIEPLKVDESAFAEALENKLPENFEKAEEKAVKAIQKHSMIIARQQRNKQIDDAYLLLGKSRYYSKRFVPALEAFNFGIENHSKSNVHNLAKVWRAKTLIRLNNEEQAVSELKRLLKKYPDLSDAITEKAHTAIAMAYTNLDSVANVIKHLNLATRTKKNKKQAARNLYILAQLYQTRNQKDSSNLVLDKLLSLKRIPYKYKIHSKIEKIKNVTASVAAQKQIRKLIKNIDNKPYLDLLYYQLGNLQKDNDSLALKSYQKSVAKSVQLNYQKQLSYEAIADIYFNKVKFTTAGAYYDSILQIAQNTNTKRIRKIARKSKNLTQVIELETIAKTNDSILKMAAMPKEQQKQYFNNYVNRLKEKDELLAKANAKKTSAGSSLATTKKNYGSKSEKWYFYNNQAVGFGQQAFKQIWGNRPLEDNWRLSDKSVIKTVQSDEVIGTDKVDASKKYNVDYYLNSIPTDTATLQQLALERNTAYYKLGVIYKEQFNESILAASKLEKVLTYHPSEKIEIPAKYHLYKIYEKLDKIKAEKYKNDVVSNYPTSNYAKYIVNSQLVKVEDDAVVNSKYARVFKLYKQEEYDIVIAETTALLSKYQSHPIAAKLNLLKAYAIGKKGDKENFKKALELVVLNYPNTEEAKNAKEIIQMINQKK